MLSLQWFVKTEPLAVLAIAAVEQGKTKFVPEHETKSRCRRCDTACCSTSMARPRA